MDVIATHSNADFDGLASMVAHRLIIADGRSQEIGRFTAIAASLIVIATAGTLLLGSLERFFR